MKKFAFLFTVFFSLLNTHSLAKENIMILKLKYGEVVLELYPEKAPNHVKRFKKLSDEGKYDSVVFHRVIDGFMAQTGDVKFGNSSSPDFNLSLAGTGGSDLPDLKAEFSDIAHSRGILSAARSADPNSANFGNLIKTFSGHKNSVLSVFVSTLDIGEGEKAYLFTGSMDTTVKIWDINATANNVGVVNDAERTFEDHNHQVFSVFVSGDYLFTGSMDNTAKMLEINSGSEGEGF